MAKKQAQQKLTPTKRNDDFRGYLKCNITKEEKEQFHEWAEKAGMENILSTIARLVDADYKFSVKTDSYGGGVQAALTCADPNNEDQGLCLTARAPDFENAIMLLMFKHIELLRSEWDLHYQDSREISEWG